MQSFHYTHGKPHDSPIIIDITTVRDEKCHDVMQCIIINNLMEYKHK